MTRRIPCVVYAQQGLQLLERTTRSSPAKARSTSESPAQVRPHPNDQRHRMIVAGWGARRRWRALLPPSGRSPRACRWTSPAGRAIARARLPAERRRSPVQDWQVDLQPALTGLNEGGGVETAAAAGGQRWHDSTTRSTRWISASRDRLLPADPREADRGGFQPVQRHQHSWRLNRSYSGFSNVLVRDSNDPREPGYLSLSSGAPSRPPAGCSSGGRAPSSLRCGRRSDARVARRSRASSRCVRRWRPWWARACRRSSDARHDHPHARLAHVGADRLGAHRGWPAPCGALCYGALAARYPDAEAAMSTCARRSDHTSHSSTDGSVSLVMDPRSPRRSPGGRQLRGFIVPLGPIALRVVAVSAIIALAAVHGRRPPWHPRPGDAGGAEAGAHRWPPVRASRSRARGRQLRQFRAVRRAPIRRAAIRAGTGRRPLAAFFSFGGWWEVTKIAGEVRDPMRSMPRALRLGLGIVTLVPSSRRWRSWPSS